VTTSKIVTSALHRVRRRFGRQFVTEAPPPVAPACRPARVAVMLAIAHTIATRIDTGQLHDQAEAARRLGVTRARVSQLLALLQLAPDLQERVLLLEAVDGIEPPLSERTLRHVLRARDWTEQRALFPPMRPTP
jgi:uncharacterized membrane protein